MTFVSQGVSRALSGRQLSGDWLLVGDQEPPLGSHLVTPRARLSASRAIYVGARKVVHYSGLRRTVCAEDRWKKFLSLISRADSTSG